MEVAVRYTLLSSYGKLLCAILVAAMMLPSSCAKKETGRYYNRAKGFSVVFPATWEIREGYMGTAVIAINPEHSDSDAIRENVNVYIEEQGKSLRLDEYYALSLENMRKYLNDFTVRKEGRSSIDGHDARWFICTHTQGRVTLRVISYLLIKEHRAYVITCSASDAAFKPSMATFDSIARSFRLE